MYELLCHIYIDFFFAPLGCSFKLESCFTVVVYGSEEIIGEAAGD
jgi:hypothetical protein